MSVLPQAKGSLHVCGNYGAQAITPAELISNPPLSEEKNVRVSLIEDMRRFLQPDGITPLLGGSDRGLRLEKPKTFDEKLAMVEDLIKTKEYPRAKEILARLLTADKTDGFWNIVTVIDTFELLYKSQKADTSKREEKEVFDRERIKLANDLIALISAEIEDPFTSTLLYIHAYRVIGSAYMDLKMLPEAQQAMQTMLRDLLTVITVENMHLFKRITEPVYKLKERIESAVRHQPAVEQTMRLHAVAEANDLETLGRMWSEFERLSLPAASLAALEKAVGERWALLIRDVYLSPGVQAHSRGIVASTDWVKQEVEFKADFITIHALLIRYGLKIKWDKHEITVLIDGQLADKDTVIPPGGLVLIKLPHEPTPMPITVLFTPESREALREHIKKEGGINDQPAASLWFNAPLTSSLVLDEYGLSDAWPKFVSVWIADSRELISDIHAPLPWSAKIAIEPNLVNLKAYEQEQAKPKSKPVAVPAVAPDKNIHLVSKLVRVSGFREAEVKALLDMKRKLSRDPAISDVSVPVIWFFELLIKSLGEVSLGASIVRGHSSIDAVWLFFRDNYWLRLRFVGNRQWVLEPFAPDRNRAVIKVRDAFSIIRHNVKGHIIVGSSEPESNKTSGVLLSLLDLALSLWLATGDVGIPIMGAVSCFSLGLLLASIRKIFFAPPTITVGDVKLPWMEGMTGQDVIDTLQARGKKNFIVRVVYAENYRHRLQPNELVEKGAKMDTITDSRPGSMGQKTGPINRSFLSQAA